MSHHNKEDVQKRSSVQMQGAQGNCSDWIHFLCILTAGGGLALFALGLLGISISAYAGRFLFGKQDFSAIFMHLLLASQIVLGGAIAVSSVFCCLLRKKLPKSTRHGHLHILNAHWQA